MQMNKAVYSIFLCSMLMIGMLTGCRKSIDLQPTQADITQAHQNVTNYIYKIMQSDSYKTGKLSYHPLGKPQEKAEISKNLTLAKPEYESLYPSIATEFDDYDKEHGYKTERILCLAGFIYKTDESDESLLFIQAKTDAKKKWYMHEILSPLVLKYRTIEESGKDLKTLIIPEIIHRKQSTPLDKR
ncbi:MAG: hypothetical protein ACYC1M_10305 [Armatimonadota bacterium]